jgi:1-acyl-sn-glycerol-3-phosphate acyltransferase
MTTDWEEGMKSVSLSAGLNEPDWRDNLTWYTHETTVARLIKTLGRPLFRLLVATGYKGLGNVPPVGPLIMAFNHISNFDVPYIVIHLPRHPFFMAKKELFKYGFGWVRVSLAAFPSIAVNVTPGR